MPRKSAIKCYFGCNIEASRGQTVTAMEVEPEQNIFANVTAEVSQATTSQIIPMDVDLQQNEVTTPHIKPKVKTFCHNKCSRQQVQLKINILKIRNKCKTLNHKIRMATKLSQNTLFLKAVEKLPEPAAIFTNMQLNKTSKMPRGRRYTLDEKIMCLTIYKQSQKAYNLLTRLFVLPSKRSLQKLLSNISFSPGVNEVIIKHLTKTSKKLPKDKKLCTIIFDEVALTPGLFYDKNLDKIIGFEDFGDRRTKQIADHALVFMLKSIKGKFKQPLCFTFCQSATKSGQLKELLKKIIKQINTTGLKVVATVCDQSATNMAVINSLIKDTKENYVRAGKEFKSSAFELDGKKVFPIFDPPHLLKGIRNNLINKNLKYVHNGEVKVAKWDHIRMLLDVDTGEDEIRLVNKLTEAHVNPEKMPKMKVKHAAQVFSQRVSAALRFMANHNILPKECIDTADLLLFIDKLFDSFNSHTYKDTAKPYRTALRKNSTHFKLWDELLSILKSMEFISVSKNGTVKSIKVPSIKNWIQNINVCKEMFEFLNNNYKISSLLIRNLNQDPLENFFCNIRSNGVRNISPTCVQFIGAFKTLLVNNITSPHSVGANCEEDNFKMMRPLKCLINMKEKEAETLSDIKENLNVDSLINILNTNSLQTPSNTVNKAAKRYVAGYLVKKGIEKICKNCIKCKLQLLSTAPPNITDYIFQRDYTGKSCKHPSEALCSFLDEICNIIEIHLKEDPHLNGIKNCIILKCEIFCSFAFLTCDKHNRALFDYLIGLSIDVIIHSWCTNINRLLKGKLVIINNDDNTKIQAINYYKAHVHKRKQ